MKIELTKNQIDEALPLIEQGLCKYIRIQLMFFGGCNIKTDEVFQGLFSNFYGLTPYRDDKWRREYFSLLLKLRNKNLEYKYVLEEIMKIIDLKDKKRVEASFASKFLATIDPEQPVIDTHVLRNVGSRLPSSYAQDRIQKIDAIHKELKSEMERYLGTKDGKYLVREFNKRYPDADITEIKMLDLVLWQTRKSKNKNLVATKKEATKKAVVKKKKA